MRIIGLEDRPKRPVKHAAFWLDIAALHPLCFETTLSNATHCGSHVHTSVQPRYVPKKNPVFLSLKALCILVFSAFLASPLFFSARSTRLFLPN
jgi:hypothetical protein